MHKFTLAFLRIRVYSNFSQSGTDASILILTQLERKIKHSIWRSNYHERKSYFSVFRRSGYHSHHSVAEREFRLRSYLLSASTADREKSWTVWKKEQISCGASKLYILEDIIDEFCDDYIVPCVQADAVYENKYLLGTSMARPADRKEAG